MVCHTIKSQLLITLTILYAQVNVCVMYNCMFNKTRSIKSIERREGHEVPPSKKSISRFVCLPDRPPRNPRGATGFSPSAWKVVSRPCPLDTSRTPYQTSGLPAGAEPSFESKNILPLPPRTTVVRPSIRQTSIIYFPVTTLPTEAEPPFVVLVIPPQR